MSIVETVLKMERPRANTVLAFSRPHITCSDIVQLGNSA